MSERNQWRVALAWMELGHLVLVGVGLVRVLDDCAPSEQSFRSCSGLCFA